jgi:hypothetical protein
MDNERDILVFEDDNGQEVQMEVLDYFEYEGEEYALLVDVAEMEHAHDHDHDDSCDHEETNIYIMKVIVNGDVEEFVPVDEDKMDDLVEAIQALYEEEEDDEE